MKKLDENSGCVILKVDELMNVCYFEIDELMKINENLMN